METTTEPDIRYSGEEIIAHLGEAVNDYGRPAREIIHHLEKPIPPKFVRLKEGRVRYLPWYIIKRLADHICPGWHYRIISIENSEGYKWKKSKKQGVPGEFIPQPVVRIHIRIIIPTKEGTIERDAIGVAALQLHGFGDPVEVASAKALRRGWAILGLGTELYYDEEEDPSYKWMEIDFEEVAAAREALKERLARVGTGIPPSHEGAQRAQAQASKPEDTPPEKASAPQTPEEQPAAEPPEEPPQEAPPAEDAADDGYERDGQGNLTGRAIMKLVGDVGLTETPVVRRFFIDLTGDKEAERIGKLRSEQREHVLKLGKLIVSMIDKETDRIRFVRWALGMDSYVKGVAAVPRPITGELQLKGAIKVFLEDVGTIAA